MRSRFRRDGTGGMGDTVGVIYPLAMQAENTQHQALEGYRLIKRRARATAITLALAVLDLAEADIILLGSTGWLQRGRPPSSPARRANPWCCRACIAVAADDPPARPVCPLPPSSRNRPPLARLERLTPRREGAGALVCEGCRTRGLRSGSASSPRPSRCI